MRARRTRFAVIAIAAASGILACGPPTHVRRYRPDLDGGYDPLDVGAPGGSGGDDTGSIGGQGGMSGSGGVTGGGGDQGGDSGQGGGGSPDSAVPDSAGAAGVGGLSATGGVSGTGGDTVDAAPDVAGPSVGGAGGSLDAGAAGAGGNGGAGGMSGSGGTGGMSGGGPIIGPGGTALCDPDPKVIAICKQLEPACENCPDKSIWNECFAMAATGNDKACARYAIQNNCKVDTGGNTCGSLNCQAKGCNKTACTTAQGNGDTTKCAPLLATCPCQ
jgi:hypothetical protein